MPEFNSFIFIYLLVYENQDKYEVQVACGKIIATVIVLVKKVLIIYWKLKELKLKKFRQYDDDEYIKQHETGKLLIGDDLVRKQVDYDGQR